MTPGDPIALGLPHREPFIFVDAVLELNPGEYALGRKVFPPEEPFFRGHFPDDPLVPGVILAEALAQCAGIAGGGEGRGFRLTAIRSMKFFEPVRPGEEIILKARKIGAVGGLWQFEVNALVLDKMVAEGMVVLSEV